MAGRKADLLFSTIIDDVLKFKNKIIITLVPGESQKGQSFKMFKVLSRFTILDMYLKCRCIWSS